MGKEVTLSIPLNFLKIGGKIVPIRIYNEDYKLQLQLQQTLICIPLLLAMNLFYDH